MKTHRMIRLVLAACLALLSLTSTTASLPDPATAGQDGKALQVLVLSHDGHVLDSVLQKKLQARGYSITKLSTFGAYRLTDDYLRRFHVIVMAGLPTSKALYGPGSWRPAQTVKPNKQALQRYVRDGGGLLFAPNFGGGGMNATNAYNQFLKPMGARYLPQQVRPVAEPDKTYFPARITAGHAITEGVEHLLYPTNVLRWDNACSTLGLSLDQPWRALARAGDNAGTYQIRSNGAVFPEPTTDHRALWAVREYEKGAVALSAIHSHYVLTHAYDKRDHVGENATGRLHGSVMEGSTGEQAQPSEGLTLLDRTLRYLGQHSAEAGFGAAKPTALDKLALPETHERIDWSSAGPPPTWRHKVVPDRSNWVFDPFPDPTIEGELQYFKALVGPRTAFSTGEGSVAAWREAALEAGYDAIFFTEKLEKTSRAEFAKLVEQCHAKSDEKLICGPGLDVSDPQGTRRVLLGVEQYPLPQWLTEDGKHVIHTPYLNLGLGGRQLVAIHRPGRAPQDPRMFKHYHGIVVATYNGKGQRIDDGRFAYQWAIASDSNPVPIALHELTSPDQVSNAIDTGFQQIMPATDLDRAVRYFRHAMANYFGCPVRYFISEGPIIDGWSIFNKDIGSPEHNRDRYQMKVGVRSDAPLKRVTLYDRFDMARQWRPDGKDFDSLVNGVHDGQHLYMLVAEDAKGRRAIAPQIRTVSRNYRLRCGDRQNWLGTQPDWCIYTGWRRTYGHFGLPMRDAVESTGYWNKEAPVFEYPFYSNHLAMTDIDASQKFVDVIGGRNAFAGDSAPMFAVQDKHYTDTQVRTLYNNPTKRKDVNIMLIETKARLKRNINPAIDGPLYPRLKAGQSGERLILPNEQPTKLPAESTVQPLPAGSYVGGVITLSDGLALHGKRIGFPAPPADTLTIDAGRSWRARYLRIKGEQWHWRRGGEGEVDPHAEALLRQMGLRGNTPYAFDLERGRLDELAYIARFKADDGAIAGRLENPESEALLFYVPLRIEGINPRHPAALWRSDKAHLDWFDVHEGDGYVTFNADESVDFFAGNIVDCAADLFVEVIAWDKQQARFRLHNPTSRAIETQFRTASAIPDHKPLKQQVTVPAGRSIVIGGQK